MTMKYGRCWYCGVWFCAHHAFNIQIFWSIGSNPSNTKTAKQSDASFQPFTSCLFSRAPKATPAGTDASPVVLSKKTYGQRKNAKGWRHCRSASPFGPGSLRTACYVHAYSFIALGSDDIDMRPHLEDFPAAFADTEPDNIICQVFVLVRIHLSKHIIVIVYDLLLGVIVWTEVGHINTVPSRKVVAHWRIEGVARVDPTSTLVVCVMVVLTRILTEPHNLGTKMVVFSRFQSFYPTTNTVTIHVGNIQPHWDHSNGKFGQIWVNMILPYMDVLDFYCTKKNISKIYIYPDPNLETSGAFNIW